MWPTSAEFATALNAPSRRWHTRVEILQPGAGAIELDVVIDGSVTVDNTAVRRSCDVRLIDVEGNLTPQDARDMLAPMGTELRMLKGLEIAKDEIEWVPLGVFGITNPSVSSHEQGTLIRLRAMDRVEAVRERRFDAPWRVAGGTSTAVAIADIVTSRLIVPTRIRQTAHTVPESLFDALSDPWDAVRLLAESDALNAYFDPLGTLVIDRDDPTPTGVTYAPGENSFLLSVSRDMTSEGTYSGVIVTGEHPDGAPIRVVRWDEDPKSPTYYLGPFGKRPYGFSSPLINTVQKAEAVAIILLSRVTRLRQDSYLTIVGHPGHDVGDLVRIEDEESKTSGDYVVQGAEIPLRPGSIRLKLTEA